eukprot:TRINITY_DN19637_c0_g1_i1.p1 TRINITY_DN19637_c0_g1~~TRINITY_DN19637_c0_g1_i1.p1  ORF type:complete len:141 (-),score=33.82 TRINITY_DN19637_c0_g1_i1:10-432(-)
MVLIKTIRFVISLFLLSHMMLPCAAERRRFQEDEDISREKIDYYTDDDEYAYSEDYYNDEYKEDDYDDSHDEVDYKTIHSKVPFHKSQISYQEAIYLPSLYRPSGRQDKTIMQRNRLRDIFLAIRRQCGGGQRGDQGTLT